MLIASYVSELFAYSGGQFISQRDAGREGLARGGHYHLGIETYSPKQVFCKHYT